MGVSLSAADGGCRTCTHGGDHPQTRHTRQTGYGQGQALYRVGTPCQDVGVAMQCITQERIRMFMHSCMEFGALECSVSTREELSNTSQGFIQDFLLGGDLFFLYNAK